ncbi:MAG: hypothetical protein EA413_06875 [Cyanobium sp. PLM2.Bin73]|nr:MAG: hypothetical protein EA413_06875 [Cyanobium sp. PLM2.Bin73]
MWNFSIPYKLKHWIALVTQPGLSFGFDPATGYYGLITGTRAVSPARTLTVRPAMPARPRCSIWQRRSDGGL